MSATTIDLGAMAHARAGDKGSTSIIMIAPYDPDDYAALRAALEPARVAEHFGLSPRQVTVTPADELRAITLVLREVLVGGVTRSARLDPHGKALSGHLLAMRVPWQSAPHGQGG